MQQVVVPLEGNIIIDLQMNGEVSANANGMRNIQVGVLDSIEQNQAHPGVQVPTTQLKDKYL